MRTRSLLLTIAAVAAFSAVSSQGARAMNSDQQSIEAVRAKFDAEIMAVDGVVSVGTGTGRDGRPCLMIGTSAPPEDVKARLPEAIFEVCVEISPVGEIKAQ
ncbi:MAG: hypothetical protein R3D45_13610 [Rhizobiaceae bacterium]